MPSMFQCFRPEKSEELSEGKMLLNLDCCSDGVCVGEEANSITGLDNCGFSTSFPLLAIPTNARPAVSCSSLKAKTERNRGSKFIFILAADMEQSERVQEQVRALSNQLSRRNIKHIAVTSASPQPMVDMSQGPPRDKNFVAACFKKASIVLMMVSPGYLRYADAYTEGARETQSDQQKLIRRFHEQLKDEYFETPTCRVWPVLHLDANRVHLPSFLREGIYYFYPPQRDTENLFVLLKGFLSNVVQRNMSFGQHGC